MHEKVSAHVYLTELLMFDLVLRQIADSGHLLIMKRMDRNHLMTLHRIRYHLSIASMGT